MTIAGTYLVETDLNNRLTAALLVKVYDDDENGAADEAVVNAAIKDAEDDVEQRLAKIYGEAGLTAVRAKGPAITRTGLAPTYHVWPARSGAPDSDVLKRRISPVRRPTISPSAA